MILCVLDMCKFKLVETCNLGCKFWCYMFRLEIRVLGSRVLVSSLKLRFIALKLRIRVSILKFKF